MSQLKRRRATSGTWVSRCGWPMRAPPTNGKYDSSPRRRNAKRGWFEDQAFNAVDEVLKAGPRQSEYSARRSARLASATASVDVDADIRETLDVAATFLRRDMVFLAVTFGCKLFPCDALLTVVLGLL
mmetsp:Transcript_88749/g.249972  ORF Transcript_88749/g.249972 Transcript_88749/m.249972 type:complete len:128 (-) Transcript_88749:824-1207(-)